MNQLASHRCVSFQEADGEIFLQRQVNVRVCGIRCSIKDEAVEDVKRGRIWPKREAGRKVMKGE